MGAGITPDSLKMRGLLGKGHNLAKVEISSKIYTLYGKTVVKSFEILFTCYAIKL